MDKTLLLFDVDMTLLSSGGAGMRAMRIVGAKLFGQDFSWEGTDLAGALDPVLVSRALVRNGLPDDRRHHQEFHDQYIRQLPAEIQASGDQMSAKPGVHELLGLLRRRIGSRGDVALGLLTGNYAQAVPLKLSAAGIDIGWFEVTACGDEAVDRAALVELAMKRYADLCGRPIDPGKVVVIGDTPRDVQCAKAHGCLCLCVATGRFSVQQLAEAGADVVVADLTDPRPLLRLIDQNGAGGPERVG